MSLIHYASAESRWRTQFFVTSAFVFIAALTYFTSDPADDDLVRAVAKAVLLLLAGWAAYFLLIGFARHMLSRQ